MELLHKKRETLVGLFDAVFTLSSLPVQLPSELSGSQSVQPVSVLVGKDFPESPSPPMHRNRAMKFVDNSTRCRHEEMSRGLMSLSRWACCPRHREEGCVAGTGVQAAQGAGKGGSSLGRRKGSCWCHVFGHRNGMASSVDVSVALDVGPVE